MYLENLTQIGVVLYHTSRIKESVAITSVWFVDWFDSVRGPKRLTPPAALTFTSQSKCQIFVNGAWNAICDILVRAWSSGDVVALYWYSLTPQHLEILPHRAQDRASYGIYRRGSDRELPGSGSSQDAGGCQYSTGRSSSLSTLIYTYKRLFFSAFFLFIKKKR